jgi:hypothetical protein
MSWIQVAVLSSLLAGFTLPLGADEAPIAGVLKAVDPTAQTVTVEATAKGKTRQVVIQVKPTSKVVRFVRATEPGKTGFVEQPIALGDLKSGSTVSVSTHHEGDQEVADVIRVVMER